MHPVRSWRLRSVRLEFTQVPRLMGIVNVTPDSFSDGGRYFSSQRAIDHALQLVDEGADLLDVGGESTRPYAEPVSDAEEIARVLPVVSALCQQARVPISIDTRKAAVAEAALEAGAELINDITGLTGDPRMVDVALRFGAGVCAMHMQGTPQTMQDNPQYHDVVQEIAAYLAQRRDLLLAAGVNPEHICLDPGIGFGKTHQHNLTLMANCQAFHALGCPILVGHSRKGFMGKVLGDKDADRTFATVGASLVLAQRGIQVLRVHDVRAVREALLMFAAAGGIDGQPWDLTAH